MCRFPKAIEDFGNEFVQMQVKRHAADYDPSGTYYKSAVMQDIVNAESVMARFVGESSKDRRAFAAWVLLKTRK